MTNQDVGAGPLRSPQQVRLTDAEWEEVEARRAAEEEGLRFYDGALLVNVEGSRRLYGAGEAIRVRPHQAGAAVIVTDGQRLPLASFSLPEASEGDIKLEHPGPPELALSIDGGTAVVQRVVTTDELSAFDEAHWLRSHWIVAAILAVSWMIVGAQVTLVEALRGSLESSAYANVVSAYLLGTIPGALLFGPLADRIGRRPVHVITAAFICTGTVLASFLSPENGPGFLFFRFLVGVAIGGEYVALNTTVQELMPSRRRGQACLAINGAFWLGLAAVVGLVSPATAEDQWRTIFLAIGGSGAFLLFLRWFLPESPRWLVAHHRKDGRTERMLEEIRRDLEERHERPAAAAAVRLRVPALVPGWSLGRVLWKEYRKQTLVCLTLFVSQAFYFNAFFFEFGPMLDRLFPAGVHGSVPIDPMIAVAAANFAGPALLGWFFDAWGRKPMISFTYAASGGMLMLIAILMLLGRPPVGPLHMAVAWCAVFFLASAAASSAYLTLGESFPVEIRASAFSLLFSAGMLCGVLGLILYDWLAGNGQDHLTALGIFGVAAATALLVAAVVEQFFGTEYARLPLEERAPPLSLAKGNSGEPAAA